MTVLQADGGSTSTADGILRNPQIEGELIEGPWDGKGYSYVPTVPPKIAPGVELDGEFDAEIDPVTYQVLRSRFWHKNLEHGDVIQRVSGSFVVVYAYDFASSLLTETGDVVTISPTLQYFSALSDLVVKWTLENRGDIREGDVFMQNDPYIAGAHQADTAVYAPVFWEGRLFCWVYNCCHIGDLGGVDPGGWAINADDIFSESVTVPPIRIGSRDGLQMDIVEAFARQSRNPSMIVLNVKSQNAGIEAMREQVLEMLEAYGPKVVKGVMRRMIRDCSEAVGERLRQIPDGTWVERLNVCGAKGEDRLTHQECLTLTKRGDRLVCTNEGTSEQGGPGNGTFSTLRSNVIAALNTALAYDQLGCTAGVADHVAFRPIPGTRNVARHPAACSAILSTLIGANLAGLVTSKMLLSGPEEIRSHANGSGGVAVPLGDMVFGIDERGRFLNIDAGAGSSTALMGSIGAFPYRDGIDTGGSWWLLGTKAGNLEDAEESGTALVLFRGEAQDTGGPGRWRGGNAAAAAYIPHKVFMMNLQLTYVDPGVDMAASLGGGYFGSGGNYLRSTGGVVADSVRGGKVPRNRADLEAAIGELERLHPRAQLFPVPAGDCVVCEYNGGGGFGDPLDREPERVLEDVLEERISAEAAVRHYGVVVGGNGELDPEATASRRQQIRSERLAGAERFPGHEQPRGSAEGAEILIAGAAGTVDLASGEGGPVWVCGGCGEDLGPAGENFKLATSYAEHHPPAVDDFMYPDPGQFGDAAIKLRQYFCPSCARLLGQEFCGEGAEPLFDIRLDPAGLTGAASR